MECIALDGIGEVRVDVCCAQDALGLGGFRAQAIVLPAAEPEEDAQDFAGLRDDAGSLSPRPDVDAAVEAGEAEQRLLHDAACAEDVEDGDDECLFVRCAAGEVYGCLQAVVFEADEDDVRRISIFLQGAGLDLRYAQVCRCVAADGDAVFPQRLQVLAAREECYVISGMGEVGTEAAAGAARPENREFHANSSIQ